MTTQLRSVHIASLGRALAISPAVMALVSFVVVGVSPRTLGRQNYGRVDDRQWFLLKSQVLADFTVVENSAEMTGFYGRKTTEFRNIRMDVPLSDRFYAGVDAVVIEDGALERDSAFWQAARGDTLALTPEEKGVEEMVGRMNTDPRWVRLMNLGKMVGSGWSGKLEKSLGGSAS